MKNRNSPCWCGSLKKWKNCHYPIQNPQNRFDFITLKKQYRHDFGILLKTPEEIQHIRKACQYTAQILHKVCALAKEGVTTNELDAYAYKLHQELGATPASLGYGEPPFPKSICTSLNDVICHGIPDDQKLANGDILNIDVSSIVDGYYGDCSAMVIVGDIDEEKKRVVEVSQICLSKAIEILKPQLLLSEIGRVIEDYARAHDCSVVNQFVGHGIGIEFHEAPNVAHHYNSDHIPLVEGMVFTIEPMINAGVRSGMIDKNNHWTVRTTDHKPSAQWEHTVLITQTGYEVLTKI